MSGQDRVETVPWRVGDGGPKRMFLHMDWGIMVNWLMVNMNFYDFPFSWE